MKNYCSQSNAEWKEVGRYHKLASNSLRKLDKSIKECIKNKKTNKQKKEAIIKVWANFGKFAHGVSDLIENGISGYTIDDYGCWDCTISMIIAELDGNIYQKRVNSKPLELTPVGLLESLRSFQIISPIGYSEDIYTDPISIITKGEIQLFLHQDYGESGINVIKSSIIEYALKHKNSVGIAMCIEGHSMFGKNNYSHWVYVDPESTIDKIKVFDPSEDQPSSNKESTEFSIENEYELDIYEVCVYSTKEYVDDFYTMKAQHNNL